MGHTDSLVIADCGLPIPPGVECIDLSLRLGVPEFPSVLDSILADFKAERALFRRRVPGTQSGCGSAGQRYGRARRGGGVRAA
ncbi:hypothetical protein JOS77_31500 [Chromobacterium haemolyticum]|nr:hypothetical protein JOS77_31500 [Chromobacterium haemolyticum]